MVLQETAFRRHDPRQHRLRRTSFLIAHRLATVRDADPILAAADGRIAGQGTHEELLSRRGACHRLSAAQVTAPVPPVDTAGPPVFPVP